jgi:histidine triad (HIT) family protein
MKNATMNNVTMNDATPAYDDNNIFARILRGELPCEKVCEDDHALVFMDIMPRTTGHALVLPKEPFRNVLDASPEVYARVMTMAQKVARASMAAFGADGVTVQQFSEPAGGQVVFHLHVHVLPRFDGTALRPAGNRGDDAEIAANAARLRAALAAL